MINVYSFSYTVIHGGKIMYGVFFVEGSAGKEIAMGHLPDEMKNLCFTWSVWEYDWLL